MAHVDGVVGNSSSGLTEMPSFRRGTINIGDRQRGRLQAKSIINCLPKRDDILLALERLYSLDFQANLPQTNNPYGEGFASEAILSICKNIGFEGMLKKSFYTVTNEKCE
jgi:GDP/UDP-N,N'-diacetylbacillosamine 2-epimerase (hydrolysing)